MALTVNLPDETPTTGARGTQVKPITEGTTMTAVQTQTSRAGFWGFLDDVGQTIGNTVGQAAQIKADQFLSGISDDTPAATVDSTGDPSDQQVKGPQSKTSMSFIEQYKKELMIGGAAVVGLVAIFLVTRD